MAPILGARASGAEGDYSASRCTDLSRISACIPVPSEYGGNAWLSARVRLPADAGIAPAIAFVGLAIYRPWGPFPLAPYQIWLGRTFNDRRVQCDIPSDPALVEPSHDGIVKRINCTSAGGRRAGLDHVTVSQAGETLNFHRMYLSELIVYVDGDDVPAAYDTLGSPLPHSEVHFPPRRRGDVAREISTRYEGGRPTNLLIEAGVLFHVMDAYEQVHRHTPTHTPMHTDVHMPLSPPPLRTKVLTCGAPRCNQSESPWHICTSACPVGVDAISASIISRSHHVLFGGYHGFAGFVISPECAISPHLPYLPISTCGDRHLSGVRPRAL